MVYNLSAINASGIVTLTQGVNTVLLGGWLGTMLLIGIAFIVYTSTIFTTNDPKKAVLMTSFTSLALSFPLVGLNLMSSLGMYICMIVTGILIFAIRNKD